MEKATKKVTKKVATKKVVWYGIKTPAGRWFLDENGNPTVFSQERSATRYIGTRFNLSVQAFTPTEV